MTKEELNRILDNHNKWLNNDPKGIRADLYGADLRSANLRSADLRSADLRSADLRIADLSGANLYGADLRSADLRSADLRSADLRSADLRGANLRGANFSGANLPINRCIPEEGNFLGYKKCKDKEENIFIVTLEIISDNRVSPIIGRKCRAEKVKTVKIESMDGKKSIKDKKLKLFGITQNCQKTVYQLEKITKSDSFNNNITIECTHGIHFFATKQEAKDY